MVQFSENQVEGVCGRSLIAKQDIFRVYLGVRTCELFLCFVAIVRVRVYFTSLFSLFYVTGEFHRSLHGGRAQFSLACVAADSFPFSGGAEIEQANEKRASEGARLG